MRARLSASEGPREQKYNTQEVIVTVCVTLRQMNTWVTCKGMCTEQGWHAVSLLTVEDTLLTHALLFDRG